MSTGPTHPIDYADASLPSTAMRTLGNAAQMAARLGALALMILYFRYQVGASFFSAGNVENIFMQSAVYTMAGLGMTMVIITGGIDLAAGSTIALSMVVTALMLNYHKGATPPPPSETHPLLWTLFSVGCGTLAGAGVGILHGVFITSLRLVPFIVTLGSMQAIRGLTKRIAGNQEISPKPGWLYKHLMYPVQGREFNWQLFPVGVWATLFAALLAAGLLRYTRLGRRIYAVGSNEATARLCGVPVARTKIVVYMMAGLFAGLAGVLEFSRLNLGQPTGAMAYELYIIAACVIGGASLMGGVGTISGTVIGALLIGVLNVGTQQIGWEKYDQEIAIGAIIIIAAALDQLRVRRMKS